MPLGLFLVCLGILAGASYACFGWQQHHAVLFLAVHHDFQRTIEADVTHKFGLFDGGHTVEDFLLQYAIAGVGINGEVTDTERGEVLEEVGALRWVYMIVLQTCLNDDTSC